MDDTRQAWGWHAVDDRTEVCAGKMTFDKHLTLFECVMVSMDGSSRTCFAAEKTVLIGS